MSDGLTFRDYQRLAARTNRIQSSSPHTLMIPLLGLAGEAGSLLSEYKKWLVAGAQYRPFADQVSEEIGDILWYLSIIADNASLDLQEIAEENLAKLDDRWRDVESNTLFGPNRYDNEYPLEQKLPNIYRVEFRERPDSQQVYITNLADGQPFGDQLTDNSHSDDGYRFHDVLHLTFATLLGWSPIVRKLLNCKRRFPAKIDEVEDGARARVTEEAISAFIFNHAQDYSYFDGVDRIPFGLLRTVKQLSHPYEVRDLSLRHWEYAILEGYRVWRMMRDNRGGIFIGNADGQTVSYELLSDPGDSVEMVEQRAGT